MKHDCTVTVQLLTRNKTQKQRNSKGGYMPCLFTVFPQKIIYPSAGWKSSLLFKQRTNKQTKKTKQKLFHLESHQKRLFHSSGDWPICEMAVQVSGWEKLLWCNFKRQEKVISRSNSMKRVTSFGGGGGGALQKYNTEFLFQFIWFLQQNCTCFLFVLNEFTPTF